MAQVRCVREDCKKIFEAPNGKLMSSFLRKAGWVWRGSQTGLIYYCDEHPPGYGGTRKAKGTTGD